MKKILALFFGCILLCISIFPSIYSQTIQKESLNSKDPTYSPGTYLIHTEWGQHGAYKRLCPYTNMTNTSRCRLGCWSVALAQIINYYSPYYNLQSEGSIDYDCSNHTINPWQIESNLDDTDYTWSNMSDKLNWSSPTSELHNVSRLLYDTAIVIQKDFGTGGYCTIDNLTHIPNLINNLSKHFPSINPYTEWDISLSEAEIVYELDHDRPIMFYTQGHNQTSGETFPHAMIIDGYQYNNTIFEIHLNYGWDGPAGLELPNTWYNYYGHFPTYDQNITFDDPKYRRGLYIRLDPTFDNFQGPECAKLPDTCTFKVTTTFDTEPPIEFKFNWGDNTSSTWLGPYRLNETCIATKTWRDSGIYEVQVKVKNHMGCESDWSEPIILHITRFGLFLPLLKLFINLRNHFPALAPLLTPLIQILCI